MSLTYLGPIRIAFHGNPSFDWTSAGDPGGLRPGRFAGVTDWPVVHQLSELTENPHREVTYGSAKGVLEVVESSDSLLSPLNGWWLFQSLDVSPDQRASVTGLVSWSLSAVRLPPRPAVVVHSARERDNVHGLTARALVVDPFGDGFQVPPPGTKFTREYDPRLEVDWESPTFTPRDLDIYVRSL